MKFSRRGFILPMIYKKANIFENEDTYIFFCRSSQLSSTLHPTEKEKRFFHFLLSIRFLWVCIKFLGLRRTLLFCGAVYYAVQGGSNH